MADTSAPVYDPTVTVDPTVIATDPAATTDTSGGSIWGSIFNNAGDILTGGASLLAAANGKPVVTAGKVSGSGIPASVTSSKTWLYVGVGVAVLVVLLIILKIAKVF